MSTSNPVAAPAAPKPPRRPTPVKGGTRALIGRFLADWVWPRWWPLSGALALTAMLAAATGAYPMIIKLSFDALTTGQNDPSALFVVLAAVIGATMTRSLLLYFQTVATNRIVTRITTDLQTRVFAHLMRADFARQTREAPGHLVSRLTNDVGFIQQGTQAALTTAIRDTLSIAALVASMIYLDWLMALIVLVVYPLAALPIAVISERLRKIAKRTQSELGDMTQVLGEKLSGARLIKTFRLEDYAITQVGRSFEDVFTLRMKAVRNRARLDPILEALGGIAVAGVIGLAYWRISSGISTVGDFMGFISALLMAAQPIRALGNLSAKVQEGLAAAERTYEVLDEAPVVVDVPGARPLRVDAGEIRFEGVGFRYAAAPVTAAGPAAGHNGTAPEAGEAALVGIDLVVPGGRTVALVGRSGGGKSTLINLVPRLFDVETGRILIDGQNVRGVTVESLRGAIAFVSQDVTLFDDTIANNIRLGRLGASDAEIEAAARAAAAHGFIMSQPNGYATRIGDRGQNLSGGQRQRLALARAILKDAPILLLDEATSALDAESEALVQEALAAFTKGRTTLVIAHRLSTVRDADLICVMEDGRIIETGRHMDLIAQGGAYARLSRTQLEPGPGAGASVPPATPASASD